MILPPVNKGYSNTNRVTKKSLAIASLVLKLQDYQKYINIKEQMRNIIHHEARLSKGILFLFLFLMEKSIIYAKITVSQFFFPNLVLNII